MEGDNPDRRGIPTSGEADRNLARLQRGEKHKGVMSGITVLRVALLAYYRWDLTEIERCPECGTIKAGHCDGCSVQTAYRIAKDLADQETALAA